MTDFEGIFTKDKVCKARCYFFNCDQKHADFKQACRFPAIFPK